MIVLLDAVNIEQGKHIDGSPLIALKAVEKFQNEFNDKITKNKKYFKIKCIFIDKNKKHCQKLKELSLNYINKVDFRIINKDFNDSIENIVKGIEYKPALFFIDPYGIKSLKRESVLSIINKPAAKDILLNYIEEGVSRIKGLTKKCLNKDINNISVRELKTIRNLYDFIGPKFINLINKDALEILKYYVNNILKSNNSNVNFKNKLDVVAFNMPYPHKCDTIYYLLFVSRNKNAIKIVQDVYAKSKEIGLKGQKSLFDSKEQLKLHKHFKV